MTTIETLLRERRDLSNYITHFTRDTNGRTVHDNLVNILSECCLKAGNEQGMAKGRNLPNQRVVCFTEAPMEVVWTLVQNNIWGRQVQLQPYGVVFSKIWARSQGVNPVWYIDTTPSGHDWLTNDITAMVNATVPTEFVRGILRLTPFFEPMGDWRAYGGTQKDFSWEREWRKVGDLYFTLTDVAGVLAPEGEHERIRAAIAKLPGAGTVKFYEPNQSFGEDR